MTKVNFFLASLVAAVPAVFLAVLLVFAFMDGGLGGLLMIMAGLAALCGIVVGVVIPLGILFFGGKSQATKSKKADKSADDDEEMGFEEDDEDVDSFGEDEEIEDFDQSSDVWEDYSSDVNELDDEEADEFKV